MRQGLDLNVVLVVLQYKDRVNLELIKPAVDWRKSGAADATMKAAVAK